MVQNRLPGGSAFSQYPSLGHEQKCILALEMGRVYREMTKAQSHNAGYLVFPSGEWSIQIHVAPFQPKDSHESWLYRCRDPTIPAKDLMLSLFRAQTDHRNKVARTIDVEVFQIMAEELAEDGWLDNIPNCLSHLDLFPHNILIHHDAAPHMPVLSAILDWDSAVLAPVFMCCVPPMWIWVWIGDEQEDEFRANDEPITAENQVLKHIFEIAAGPVYMRFAYETPYRLARRLMTFAIETRDSAYEVRDTIVMCEEWIVFTRNRGKHSKLISFTPFNDLKKVLRLRGL